MKNKKTPDIRFKGFTDDWEQRKLENWGTFYYGKSCPKWSITDNANIPCIRYGELYTKFGTKIDKIYSYTNMSPENLKFSKGKEVLIPRVGEDPMDYNHCTWLSMPNIAIGEMISVFNTENDPLFTATMFNATLQNEFACRVEGGSVTNLYFEKLKNIEVSFPKIDEQKKIGKYFDSLDNRITLHQRKLEKLKNFKKAMLEKMFPKNGKKTPEIRFQGFTDDWEQRKLKELVEFNPSEELPDEFEYVDLESVVGTEMISHRHENKATAPSRAQRVAHQGDLFYQTVRPYQKNNYLFDKPDNDYVFSTGYAQMRPYIDGHFLLDLVQTERFVKIVLDNCTGTSYPAINANDLSSIKITYPQCRNEQQTIGVFLASIDNLITLHQRKLEFYFYIRKQFLGNSVSWGK